ncbi:acetoin dehydrogenase E2 subunit dihydrolipoyllysine-residue acetyltransferase [Ruegeria denitrificans]|uniref:Acetoin dehydrogenase E2 subunit dihydrolipoyllysine-residue acetyltransferase n=1 Tax=Ruegeria denitrificans TaxID=1715692 RepID=A0A0P1IH68_9RHOB|nr:alpha/beta fold hydrolase [Ruegeria denitrificans]CUK12890.1 acetoin dehydrogenase E2 subunit dihydrolipoyllysine-residue acetyltransferase [Ruegeria denitrificans]
MADFLLVHGSCHGAWCWRDMIPALTALGHTARAIDLPSHGSDPTSIADVTLDSCRDTVLSASTPQTIIVGHSWGGYPVSAAAETTPDAMRALIYLCAYVPQDGLSMVEMRKRAPRQLIVDAVEKSTDGLSYTVRPDMVHDLFYHDCPPETVPYALARMCPQPIAPQETPLFVSDNFARVPKAYIRATDDHTIPTEYEEQMSHVAPKGLRADINSSHSPFFSHPRLLSEILDDLEQKLPAV